MECPKLYETLTSSLVSLLFGGSQNCKKFLKDSFEVFTSSNYRCEFMLEVSLLHSKTGKASFWLQSKGKKKLKDCYLCQIENKKLCSSLSSALQSLTDNLNHTSDPDKIAQIQKRRFLGRLQSLSKLFLPSSQKTKEKSFMHTFKEFLMGIEIEIPIVNLPTPIKRNSEHKPSTQPQSHLLQRKFSETKPFFFNPKKTDFQKGTHHRTQTEANYNFKHKRSASTIFTKDDSIILLTDESELDHPIADSTGRLIEIEIFRKISLLDEIEEEFETNHSLPVSQEFKEIKNFFTIGMYEY